MRDPFLKLSSQITQPTVYLFPSFFSGSDEHERQWSFPGALLYSITVITTIGEKNSHNLMAEVYLTVELSVSRRVSCEIAVS